MRTIITLATLLLTAVASAQVAPPVRAPRETARPYQRPQVTVPQPDGSVWQYDGPETMPRAPVVIDMGTAAERKAAAERFIALCKPYVAEHPGGGISYQHYATPACERQFYR